MKKTMLILSLLLMVALLSAIDFEISGEDRVRAAPPTTLRKKMEVGLTTV
jgi:outer membrane lipopolysaccharide assembly protein LptE/RlpB